MRKARAALAILLAFSVPVRAETTTDPLWYLLSTYVLAPDAKAIEAQGESPGDSKGLAALQSDLLLLSDGFESFRDESQVKETLARLAPRMSPELRPFFKDRASSLDTIYRTLAVTDYTWAQRFPEPPCAPVESRRKLLAGRDGLFQSEGGEASPWLVALLGPQAEGNSAEQALDQASSQTKLANAEYEKLRARIRKLTLALASEQAVGAARSKLYCSRASAFEILSASHRAKDTGLIAAGRSNSHKPEDSVFVVVWKGRRAAATLLKTKNGLMLVTDASVVAETDHPYLFAYTESTKPVSITASVVRRSRDLSVAVLTHTEDLQRPALALADEAPAKDDLVSAVGHTLISGPWTKTSGLVTKVGDVSFQTDASISPELSGAPVLNEAGEVAGILVLRPADTEEGLWPIAIPAPVLTRWLEDLASAPIDGPATEAIEDAGTAAILSRARPGALTETGLGAWTIPPLPPPPPTPHGVCIGNCGSPRAPSSSYSSGSSRSAGTDALGEALGELTLALIFKGIPALFRGIGKLFKANEGSAKTKAVPRIATKPVEPPPPPPKPICGLKLLSAPETAGTEPFEMAVQYSCDDRNARISGHPVSFTVGRDNEKPIKAPTSFTDSNGIARLVIQIDNEETAVHNVKTKSERSHDDLDRYSREFDRQGSQEQQAGPAHVAESVPFEATSQDVEPIDAAGTVTAEKAAKSAVVVGTTRKASSTRKLLVVVGKVRRLRLVGAIGGVPTGGISLVASVVATEVVFALGDKALKAYDKKSDEEDDCALKPGEEVLDRFIDGTRLAPGFLHRHEGKPHGHTIEKHVKKTLEYLEKRLERIENASSFDDERKAESVIRSAIQNDLSNISAWATKKTSKAHEAYYEGDPSSPIGYGIELSDPLLKARLRYNAFVYLKQQADCRIFILTAFPQ